MTPIDREDINKALETLKNGGLILYPTDTIWGIGCDATNPEAVDRVIQLKGRSKEKSMIVLLHNENQLAGYVNDIPEVAYQLIEYTEHPLTIVYSNAKNLAANAIAEDGSIGIRIVNHPFCTQLLQRFRKPIISTSANISGEPSAKTFGDIDQKIKDGVDYTVQFGQKDIGAGKASTIMKLDPSGKFEFIRK
ncbi:Sua5/YciO/YrdC/YwlC family protein [Sphingobacterium spiritivorum ATCC 33300]|uniref:L-threonylcarbamoyladenylate synthase n=1 Tax=Sphingobacterium spiritivorum ATCC 33300 TaxID=525372 RepID=C2FZG9_SPHSI|nr:L-threonylcarbamoyladenylate synthase [Sphingobacterium spiritivorum]EEI91682.1 Sua5/YciO/YrdC/YwlC family protein [Sphingobacterium spiritivorum ATCC 33300]QQS97150.1 threonylcarbamoyl-AMP synthase [Sphingobacterium spiritivorum]